MREFIQLDVIRQILTDYDDRIPLHVFLKDYYKKHRQFGSRDRKFYTDVIYKYFRCKTLFNKIPFEEKLCYSGFLTSNTINDFYNYLFRSGKISEDLPGKWNLSQEEKIQLLIVSNIISWENYFPAKDLIAKEINADEFIFSHLEQPKFYIRVPENKIEQVKENLSDNNISFENSKATFAFESQTDISKFIPENYFEVQDISSQETIELFNIRGQEKVWDCCCGAGGKSLMLLERFPDLNLYCSDNRESILDNLKIRFKKNNYNPKGIGVFDAVKTNRELSFDNKIISEGYFDLIVADVPCSGSGTWGRNPERLYQFKEAEINVYCGLQKSIIANTIKYLKPGGKLIFITCSVYYPENTGNIISFEKLGLKVIKQNYFIGYTRKADTLFGAVLEKVS